MNIFGDEELEVKKAKRTRMEQRGRSGYSSLKRKIKVSSGTQEAVTKVIGFAKSAKSAKQMIDYISRNGDVELTDHDGLGLQYDEERLDIIKDWEQNFPTRKDGRYAMHFMVSAPKGSDHAATITASREFGETIFGEYDYVLASHFDEDHPHTHFIVARKIDGPALNPRKEDLQKWREAWAEIGTRHGISMVASKRIERGKTRRSDKQRDIHIRKREGVTKNDVSAAKEVLAEYHNDNEKPWDLVLEKRLQETRTGYEQLARSLKTLAAQNKDGHEMLDKTARLVSRQSMILRKVITRRHILREIIASKDHPKITPQSSAEDLAKAYVKHKEYLGIVQSPARDSDIDKSIKKLGKTLGDKAVGGDKATQDFLKLVRDRKSAGQGRGRERKKDFGLDI